MVHLTAQTLNSVISLSGVCPNPNEWISDVRRVQHEVLLRGDMNNVEHHDIPCYGTWDVFEKVGYAFQTAETKAEKEALRWQSNHFKEVMLNAVKSLGKDGHFIGLCAKESRGRKINVKTRGQHYVKKDGVSICLPMAWWSAKDIWAYHVVNDLPYLRIYDESPRGREQARSHMIFATLDIQEDWVHSQGVWQEWQQTYPDEFNAWLDRFPELREGMI